MAADAMLSIIVPALDRGDARGADFPDKSGEYWALCPFHHDTHASNFSVSERGYKCLACGAGGGLAALAERLGVAPEPDGGLTLEDYAVYKHLPVGFLAGLGLSTAQWRTRDGVKAEMHMPYKDERGKTIRVRRRLTLRKASSGKDGRFRWARGTDTALYGLGSLAQIRKLGWVILVEGESDCHTLWFHGIPALGIPGAQNYKAEWSAHLHDLEVLVWREPDEGGDKMVAKLRELLPKAKVLTPPEGIKDISQAHCAGADIPALVAELKASAKPIGELQTWVDKCMALSDLAPWITEQLGQRVTREVKLDVARAVTGWLLKHNRLLLDVNQDTAQGGRPYLVADDGAVWPLTGDAVTTRMALFGAGLNGTETSYRFVVEHLSMSAFASGRRMTLARWQAADGLRLAVSAGPTHYVTTAEGALRKAPNGTDNLWFAGDACYPAWTPAEPVFPLDVPAFNPRIRTPDEIQAYDQAAQRDLLCAWMAALLSGLRPLPALIAVGDKGGGKTLMVKAILRMLLGPSGNVVSAPQDIRDYWAQVTSLPLIGYDNVDVNTESWFADEIANTVTGKSVEMRELFTTLNRISRPATAAIAVTTRTASFCRPDIAERTLPILTEQFGDNDRLADTALMDAVDAARDGLLSWAALTSAELLRLRHEAPPGLPLRFVDFAQLAWAYTASRGDRARGAHVLLALRQAQALTIGQADPLTEAVIGYLPELLNNSRVWQGSASQLAKALSDAGADLPFLGGGRRIATTLRESKATLALVDISLEETKWSKGQRTEFILQRVGAGAPQLPLGDDLDALLEDSDVLF